MPMHYIVHIRYSIYLFSTEKESIPKGMTKGDLLRARNLTRYINQLRVCKTYCEKRIHLLGGPDYKSYTSEEATGRETNVPGRKVRDMG